MAIQMIDTQWVPYAKDYRREYVIDSAADLATLPECAPGSTAIVADKDGAIYMVNASGEWREL